MFAEFYKWRVENDVDNAIWVSDFNCQKTQFPELPELKA